MTVIKCLFWIKKWTQKWLSEFKYIYYLSHSTDLYCIIACQEINDWRRAWINDVVWVFLSHVGIVNMVRIGPYEQSFKLSSIIARYKLWWLKRTRSSQRNIPCSDQPTHVQIKWERNYILLWNTNQSCLLHPFTIRMYYNARL